MYSKASLDLPRFFCIIGYASADNTSEPWRDSPAYEDWHDDTEGMRVGDGVA